MTTNGNGSVIRDAGDADMAAVQAIYAHHVLNGLASFEIEPPELAEMIRRRGEIVAMNLPYLVAEISGRVGGFAYASEYRSRPAYRHTVEDSVYVSPDFARRGLGRRLLDALVGRCTELDYRQMIAVIGDSANAASINLHRKAGFEDAGAMRSTGFKFGRWVDTTIMQRALGDGDASPPGNPGGEITQ